MKDINGILQIVIFNIMMSIVLTGGLAVIPIVLFTLLGIPLYFESKKTEGYKYG